MPKHERPEGKPPELDTPFSEDTTGQGWDNVDRVGLLKERPKPQLPGESDQKLLDLGGLKWGDRMLAAPPPTPTGAAPAEDIIKMTIDDQHNRRRFVETRTDNTYLWQQSRDGTWSREGAGDSTRSPKDPGKVTLKVKDLTYDDSTKELTYKTDKSSVANPNGGGVDASWVQTKDGTRTGTLDNSGDPPKTIEIKTNAKGEITEVTDANGVTRTFTYDDKHNISSFTETQGDNTVTYGRDSAGHWITTAGTPLRAMRPPTGKITVDEVGNLTEDKHMFRDVDYR